MNKKFKKASSVFLSLSMLVTASPQANAYYSEKLALDNKVVNEEEEEKANKSGANISDSRMSSKTMEKTSSEEEESEEDTPEEIELVPDEQLRIAMHNSLGTGQPLTKENLATIKSLKREKVSNIEGIQYCTSLETLNLGNSGVEVGQITDISALAGLKSLKEVHLVGNRITDISALGTLPNLEVADLMYNTTLTDWHALINCSKLTNLHITGTNIPDISRLKEIITLKVFQAEARLLGDNDIKVLEELPLEEVILSVNQITSLETFRNITTLKKITITNNKIVDLEPISQLPNLEYLKISYNKISDLTKVADMHNLKYLNLTKNEIEDVTPISNLDLLDSLILDRNKIQDISSLKKFSEIPLIMVKNQVIELDSVVVDQFPFKHIVPIKWWKSTKPLDGQVDSIDQSGNYSGGAITWDSLNPVLESAALSYKFSHFFKYNEGAGDEEKFIFSGTVQFKYRTDTDPEILNAVDKSIMVGDPYDKTMGENESGEEVSVKALDPEDGDITSDMKITGDTVNTDIAGVYNVVYTVIDSDGNEAEVKTKVTVSAGEAPKILYAKDKTIFINDPYDETMGEDESGDTVKVIATDKEDGDITSKMKIEGDVDVKTPSVYPVVYKVTDTQKNTAEVSTTVTVTKGEAPEISNAVDKKIYVNDPYNATMGEDESGNIAKVIATDKEDGDLTDNIVIEENVNTSKEGTYLVTYSVVDSHGNADVKTTTVTVTKGEAPEILYAVDKTIYINGDYDQAKGQNESGDIVDVIATDKEDGDLTDKIVIDGDVNTSQVGTYSVTYRVVDSHGNFDEKTTTVTVTKGEAPEISNAVDKSIYVNDPYDATMGEDESGNIVKVIATDKEDGDLTDKIVIDGDVNTSQVGTYSVTYRVVDSHGNFDEKTTTVTVIKGEDPEILYAVDKTIYINGDYDQTKGQNESGEIVDVIATDKEDGDITERMEITGDVDVTKIGTYPVVYKVTDSQGNTVEIATTVTVKKKSTGGGGGTPAPPPVNQGSVILASGEKYTDVLTATVLGNEKGSPILLTEKDNIDENTLSEIKRLKVNEVIIAGGESSVSNNVVEQLKDYKVRRVAGEDRYETAIKVGDEVRSITGNLDAAMLVDGTNFPDVITISSLASKQRVPILITTPENLTSATKETINEWSLRNVTIGGSYNSVSKNIEDGLEVNNVKRLGGTDRYETASIIGEEIRSLAENKDDMILVDGTDFPDGITINSIASRYSAPIMLTTPENLTKITGDKVRQWTIKNVLIGGGLNSVSQSIEDGLNVGKIERVAGADRYDTAVKISKRLYDPDTHLGGNE